MEDGFGHLKWLFFPLRGFPDKIPLPTSLVNASRPSQPQFPVQGKNQPPKHPQSKIWDLFGSTSKLWSSFCTQIKTNSILEGKSAQNHGIIRAGKDFKSHCIPIPRFLRAPSRWVLSTCGILVDNFSSRYFMNHPVRLGLKWSGLKEMNVWGCLWLNASMSWIDSLVLATPSFTPLGLQIAVANWSHLSPNESSSSSDCDPKYLS